jgi:hypothetical protein
MIEPIVRCDPNDSLDRNVRREPFEFGDPKTLSPAKVLELLLGVEAVEENENSF